jgi:two-component system, chemotaxis family, CheB/CheR fusion protein
MAIERKRRGNSSGADLSIEQIIEHIHVSRNFDFRNYKRPTLRRRIERRMTDRQIKSAAEYLALIERDPREIEALVGSMLIKVTDFFRDRETWDLLSSKVIPQLLSEKRGGEDIRVWCAGCATGEEAFSVAILLAEAMGPAFQNQDVKIFGTDADEKSIAFARRGVYSRDQVQSLPPEILKSWFVEDATGFSVRKEIRRTVVFGVNNLVSDAPISRLDLLLCRNVFIYLDGQLQKRVLTRFHHALRRNGLLVLGKSELIPFAAKVFEPVDLQRRIYRKDGKRESAVAQERLLTLLEQDSVSRAATSESDADMSAVEQFHRDAFQASRIPMIATAADGTVLLWNPAATALWGPSESDATGKKLTSLALTGLAGELLVEKTAAVREGRSALEIGEGSLQRPKDQHPVHISVQVTALRDSAQEISGVLYSVHDVTPLRELETELRKVTEERQSAFEELRTINEELQSANEELETTNEELQSANEELQTTNEELQSTNEELETTNEELQSTNAELDATNRELAHRTEELNSLAFVQRTTIRTLNAAVMVLDATGRIKMWNLAAERLLGIPEDEAVGQLLWSLNIPALDRGVLQKMRRALGQNSPLRADQIAYELPNGTEGRASVAAIPILDGGTALGAVIIFEDATRLASLMSEVASLRAGNGQNGKSNRR